MTNVKRVVFGSLVVAGMLFTGCGSNQPEIQKQPDMYVNPELKGAPNWVLMPQIEGAIAELGTAPRNAANDIGFQREEAMANARDNLARQIETKVANMFKSFKATTGGGADATFDKSSESVSKQIANQSLSGTVVKSTWISSSGTLYILMAVSNDPVKQQMEKSIKTSYKNDQALYQKFLASKAQGELDAELSKMKQ